jgi:hypothetical protein
MSHLIEPFSPWAPKPSRKKHWMEIAEEEQLFFSTLKEATTQHNPTSVATSNTAAPAGGTVPISLLNIPSGSYTASFSWNNSGIYSPFGVGSAKDGFGPNIDDKNSEHGILTVWKGTSGQSMCTASLYTKPYLTGSVKMIIYLDSYTPVAGFGTISEAMTDFGFPQVVSGSSITMSYNYTTSVGGMSLSINWNLFPTSSATGSIGNGWSFGSGIGIVGVAASESIIMFPVTKSTTETTAIGFLLAGVKSTAGDRIKITSSFEIN